MLKVCSCWVGILGFVVFSMEAALVCPRAKTVHMFRRESG